MAASATATIDPETKETVSRCTTVAEKGAHTFKIVGYCLQTKGMRPGKSVQSGTFIVGGGDWVLRFYPNYLGGNNNSPDQSFIFIELLTKNVEVRVRCEVWLVERPPSGSLRTLWLAPAPAPDQQQQVFVLDPRTD